MNATLTLPLVNRKHSPFDEELIAFCVSLSENLQEIKGDPALAALAFWLRKGNLLQMKSTWDSTQSPNTLRVPRGLVFHIPPSNVDTMFVYSWILSLLMGNANAVRLPTKKTTTSDTLFECVKNTLKHYPELDQSNRFISYGHDLKITEEISKQSDVRVIWGGDQTVNTIRSIPLKPSAKELVFCDRSSFSVIDGNVYCSVSKEEKATLAKQFFNDTFWFDQAACSSPRTLYWLHQSCEEFYTYLSDEIKERAFEVPLGGFLDKLTFTMNLILESPIQKITTYHNELTVIHTTTPPKEHCGRGLLYHVELSSLNDLIPFIDQKDQTMTYYGIKADEVARFVQQLNGRGVDRAVPIGQALQFTPIWDGYHLLEELTRLIKVPGEQT